MTIGETLKEKRTEYRLTQEELSEKIFVSRKTTPDIDSLIRLANLFHLSLDNLLLEGSDIVENIKNDMELKTLKGVRVANIFISIGTVLIIFIDNLSLTTSAIMILIAACNLIISFYIEAKVKKIKTK